jgi:hypothetical protein
MNHSHGFRAAVPVLAIAILVASFVGCAPTAHTATRGIVYFDEPYDGPIETVALILDTHVATFTRETEATLYDAALYSFMNHPYAFRRYDLIERSRLDAITAEFELARSGLINASTAAELGRLLGAQSIILMSVSNVSAAPYGASVSGIGLSVFDVRASLQMRMVDVETGRILAAVQQPMQKVVLGSFRMDTFRFAGSPQDAAVLTVVTEGAKLAIDDMMRAASR